MSDYPRCEICKWYQPMDLEERDDKFLTGRCMLADMSTRQEPRVISGGRDSYAILLVSEEFGCVQHEGWVSR